MFDIRLRQLRKSLNMSQVEMARRLGVSKQSISNWENDNILPSIEMLRRIAETFYVTSDFLLGLDTRDRAGKSYLEITGLSVEKISHIQQIVEDMRS